jgi:hypothetical protein
MKHVYIFDGNSQYAMGTGFIIDNNGNMQNIPKGVTQQDKILYSKFQDNPNITFLTTAQLKNTAKMNEQTRNTMVNTEDNSKDVAKGRVENPNISYKARRFKLGIANASGVPIQVLLGDPSGLIARGLAIPALPGGVTISGSYGTDTLDILNEWVASGSNVRMTALQESASSANAYNGTVDGAALSFCQCELGVSTVEEVEFDYSQFIGADALNLTQRLFTKAEFDFTLGVPTALVRRFDTALSTTMGFTIYSTGVAQIMMRDL